MNHGPDLVDIPDKYVKVIERLLEMGADPNKNPVSDNPARQPESTIRVFLFSASNVLKTTNERAERHPEEMSNFLRNAYHATQDIREILKDYFAS